MENLNNSESIKSLIFGNENYLALDTPMSFKDGQEACKRISGQIAKLEGKVRTKNSWLYSNLNITNLNIVNFDI